MNVTKAILIQVSLNKDLGFFKGFFTFDTLKPSSPPTQSAFSLPYWITASPSKRKQEKLEREKRTKIGEEKNQRGEEKKSEMMKIPSVAAAMKNTVLLLLEQALLCFFSLSPTTPYRSSHFLVNDCLSTSAAHTNFMLSDTHLLQEYVNDIICISHVCILT